MKRTMKTTLAASALAIALGTGAATAQEAQLADSTLAGIAQLGVDVPAGTVVTEDEAALIENVLSSTDSRDQQVSRIEEILGLNAVAGDTDLSQLRDSVSTEMAALGMDPAPVKLMSDEELIRVENVTGSGDDEVLKRQRIEEILADGGYVTAADPAEDATHGLAGLVEADLAKIGMNDVAVDDLPLETLTLIRGVTSSSDDAVEQRSRVERILAE